MLENIIQKKSFKIIKKIWLSVVNFIEVVIPTISFFILFIVFLIGIFSRYVVRQPVPWTYELSLLTFITIIYLAFGYATKKKELVAFSLVYEKFNEKIKKVCRIVSNILIVGLVIIIIVPGVKGILGLSSITGVLRIPLKYAFLPFIFMAVDMVIRALYQLFVEIFPKQAKKLSMVTNENKEESEGTN